PSGLFRAEFETHPRPQALQPNPPATLPTGVGVHSVQGHPHPQGGQKPSYRASLRTSWLLLSSPRPNRQMRPKPSPLSLPFRLRLTSALTPADLISAPAHRDTMPRGTPFRPFGSIRGVPEIQPRPLVLLPKPPGKLLIE